MGEGPPDVFLLLRILQTGRMFEIQFCGMQPCVYMGFCFLVAGEGGDILKFSQMERNPVFTGFVHTGSWMKSEVCMQNVQKIYFFTLFCTLYVK